MKTKLFFTALLVFSLASLTIAQCTMTLTPTQVFGGPGSYTTTNIGGGVFQICSNTMVYDTLGNGNQRKYYLMNGAQLIIKGTFSHFIYLQGTANVTRLGTSGGTNYVYYEPTATITGTTSMNTTSCTAVSFPTVACNLGLTEKTFVAQSITVYPNPASDHFTIINDNNNTLNCVVTNKLGQKIKSFTVENGNKIVEISDLAAGIYYLSVSENNKVVSTKKLIITK